MKKMHLHKFLNFIGILALVMSLAGLALTPAAATSTTAPTHSAAATSAYNWLKNQMRSTGLVASFESNIVLPNGVREDNMCVIYDQAVAVDAFLVMQDFANARRVLNVLRSMQLPDGSWYTSYFCDKPLESPATPWEYRKHVGQAVWVALAVAKYEEITGDTKSYHQMGDWAVNWAYSFMQADGATNGGVSWTNGQPETFAGTEFNLDVYAASLYYGGQSANAAKVRYWLENNVWTTDHWISGRNDQRMPLDVNAWGATVFGTTSPKSNTALDFNIANLKTTINGITGYDFDLLLSKPYPYGTYENGCGGSARADDLWFEGMGEMVVAFNAVGRTAEATSLLAEIVKAQKPNGGVPYSLLGTCNSYWVMTANPSVSSTGWLVIADGGMNPMRFAGTSHIAPVAPVAQSTPTPGTPDTLAYNWLKSQMRATNLVASFESNVVTNGVPENDLCVTYDQAVAVDAFLIKGDYAAARAVLAAMSALQLPDGTWYTMYRCLTKAPHEYRKHVGPSVWMALAVAKYEQVTGDIKTFHEMGERTVNWAYSFLQDDGGVNGGFSWTNGHPETFAGTEFNLDVYAASLYFFGPNDPRGQRVRYWLDHTTWNTNHWISGRNDQRMPLDVNAWGATIFGTSSSKSNVALDFNIANLKTTINGIAGYDFDLLLGKPYPYGTYENGCDPVAPLADDLWFEGMGEMVVAFRTMGRTAEATSLLAEIVKAQQPNGGVPYSLLGTCNSYWTMTNKPSISSTGWLIFGSAPSFNPFNFGSSQQATGVAPSPTPAPLPDTPVNRAYNWLKNQRKLDWNNQPNSNGMYESLNNYYSTTVNDPGLDANKCVTYDEALIVYALLAKGDISRARELLAVMHRLQLTTGAWYTIYGCAAEPTLVEWRRHVGPIAWVAMAVAKYELVTGDTKTFHEMGVRALESTYAFHDQTDGGVNGGLSWTNSQLETFAGTEYNLDIYSASLYFGGNTNERGFTTAAGKIKSFLDNVVWNQTDKRFISGRNDLRAPLDVNAWGVSALGLSGTRNYAASLDYNMANLRTTITNPVTGIASDAFDFDLLLGKPYAPGTYENNCADGVQRADDIWLEGTGEMVVALKLAGRITEANHFIDEMIKQQIPQTDLHNAGGLQYSLLGTCNSYWKMTRLPAISSTAWLVFGDLGLNPFDLNPNAVAPTPTSPVATATFTRTATTNATFTRTATTTLTPVGPTPTNTVGASATVTKTLTPTVTFTRTLTPSLTPVGPTPTAPAGTCSGTNLIVNPGFESGSLNPWALATGNGGVTQARTHTGAWASYVGTSTGRLEQVVNGLSPNTTYTLCGWYTLESTSSTVQFGVKNYGGTQQTQTITTSASFVWVQRSLTFTTGASNTSATIFFEQPTVGGNYGYSDDWSLTQSGGSSPTPTNTVAASATPTRTNTPILSTATLTRTPTQTVGASPTRTDTPVLLTATPTRTATPTLTRTPTQTVAASPTQTVAASPTLTKTPGGTGGCGTGTNLIVNPGFENGSLNPWTLTTGNGGATQARIHAGTWAGYVGTSTGRLEQVVSGLSPNITYTLCGWYTLETPSSTVQFGVKNHGGAQQTQTVTTSGSFVWVQLSLTFTTGASNTSATIFFEQPTVGGNYGYSDDWWLVQAP